MASGQSICAPATRTSRGPGWRRCWIVPLRCCWHFRPQHPASVQTAKASTGTPPTARTMAEKGKGGSVAYGLKVRSLSSAGRAGFTTCVHVYRQTTRDQRPTPNTISCPGNIPGASFAAVVPSLPGWSHEGPVAVQRRKETTGAASIPLAFPSCRAGRWDSASFPWRPRFSPWLQRKASPSCANLPQEID